MVCADFDELYVRLKGAVGEPKQPAAPGVESL